MRRGVILLLAVGIAMPAAAPILHAQTEGPLTIEVPSRRPPARRRQPPPPPDPETDTRRPRDPIEAPPDSEQSRPVLKRKGQPAAPATVSPSESGACPEGYIAVRTTEERPRLRRGASPSEPATDERQVVECYFSETVVDAEGAVIEERGLRPGLSGDPLIEELREQIFAFSETLPDFICDQVTNRLFSESNPPKWKTQDRIEAEVLYLDGKEQYQNLRRNGKKIRSDPESTGAWSTGEFGTLIQGLFHPQSDAKFEFDRASEVGGTETRVYTYEVEETNSRWRVEFEQYELYPAYRGSIWIDPEKKKVLRIEMVATSIPPDYPLDTLEMTVDYGPVSINDRTYYLATHSRNLACKRYTRYCSKNEIAFRDYRKFSTESTVMTTDSSVTYGEEGDNGEGPQLAEPPQIEENKEPRKP